MKLKNNSTNISQMDLETKERKERREKESKEKTSSVHLKCA